MKNDFIELLRPQNIFMVKKRLGPSEDGGYVMPEFVFENCAAIMTYGVGNDSRFEEEFNKIYNKPAYLFDHTLEEDYWKRLLTWWKDRGCEFFPCGLGFGENCKEFYTHYQELNINGYVLLKIDIEGGEYEYFLKTDISKMESTVMGLSLEVHWINDIKNRENLVIILNKLSEYFVLCHTHGNNWGEIWSYENEIIPVTLELSFINKKFIEKYEPDTQNYPIPGLDIPNNPHKEDYQLKFLKLGTSDYKNKVNDDNDLKISIGDVLDRYTICRLKSERGQVENSKEIYSLLKKIKMYDGVQSYVDQLYKLNGDIWDLESDIRKGNENILGLEEVGRRALILRDLNKIRVSIKNEANSKYNEGYIEVKIDHGSETEPSVIISLTTVPERLEESYENAIISTIKSLCEQEDNDYEIHFNIPKIYNITKQPYIIPEWLQEMKLKYPHLKVFRTEDMGPPTKFIPTLDRVRNPETLLLVVDDDLVYHPEMIKEHRKYQELLKDSAIVYEGREPVTPMNYGDIRDSWILCVTGITEVRMFQHYKSASYKKKYFKEDFFINYVGETYSDDVLVSKYFRDHGIKMFVVPYEKDVHLFQTKKGWDTYGGVTSFPVLRHTSSNAHQSGCNHPGLLAISIGGRFYTPIKWER